ncbi:5'-methylthioadenosine/adenosylhomocysteine nucleosidase [Marinicella sp. S1101]|uniref:5'-methylthioadenosine/adenosylhomocysteine nucleosidase n=1 Tax=Marinicella marina TaxID=2996016 RepID=UPI002260EF9E|nr:5'-methylthioadenosine/adenosylhomocysteine nucleosidase [Marinicella marina]MCX7555123.1 5'-methylthioadenosine/adenosylhomocysteine nucleosidase [Marinicella marina]MDJ1140332.1 5'-methylthioadenosine/adenosylhomocysteine nucleosidase [Marinicella marina]
MKIGIIAAMHQECEFFRQLIQAPVHSRYLDIKITHGQYAGHPVCLLESGIGKVNATIAAEWVIREFAADLIINTGSAGGIKAGVAVGDFVFAEKVCHHDVDVSPIGFKFGELPRLPVYYPIKKKWLERLDQLANLLGDKHHIGTIATGESFIYQNPQVDLIKQRFPEVLACEMEAAAVAQVCHLHEIDYMVIRNLSDIAGQDAQINFNQYIQQAGQKSTELVLALIDSIS